MVLLAEYNITMNQLNSSGTYDTLYPTTIPSQVGLENSILLNSETLILPDSTNVVSQVQAALGLPSSGITQIETGSYIGTGGVYASKSLTFNFVPKILVISSLPSVTNGGIWILSANSGCGTFYRNSSATTGLYSVSVSGTTITISSYPAEYWATPNFSGITYNCVALG